MRSNPRNSSETKSDAGRAPARGRAFAIGAALWLGLVVYGGLVPFAFDVSRVSIDAAGGIGPWLADVATSPRWLPAGRRVSTFGVPIAVSDWAVNLALFAPFAALAVWSRPRRRWVTASLAAVGVAAATSWAIECVQSLSPLRYAAMQDVLANTASAAIGALVAAAARPAIGPAAFWAFRRSTPARHALLDASTWWSARPRVAAAVAGLLGTAIAASSWAAGRAGGWGGPLPFASAFRLDYDVAAWRLGSASVGYAVLLLAVVGPLALTRTRTRWGLELLLAAVAGWAVVIELGHAIAGGEPGPTGPLLAVLVAMAAAAAAGVLTDVVRRRDRRRAGRPVSIDRRRRSHRYG